MKPSISSLKHLLPILLLAACTANNETETAPKPSYPHPQTVAFNHQEGYTINSVTGDTITPIITQNGDTLLTGVPVTIAATPIDPDSMAQPRVLPFTSSDRIHDAQANVRIVPNELTIVPVNKDSLTQVFLDEIPENDSLHYLITARGDTLKTGVPIPAKVTKVPSPQPEPVKALSPRFKDGANRNIQYLDVDQGLAASYVYSTLEDKRGNIWFGTFGGGASRYDGERFTHFTEKEGLSNNTVWCMLEDQYGNIWFGTDVGVSKYDGEGFTHFSEKDGLDHHSVRTILEDKEGNLWFGTSQSGVSRYDGKTITRFTRNEGLSHNSVQSIIQDKDGNLWFGTAGGGVNLYDGKSFTYLTEKNGLSNDQVYAIQEDQGGDLWFGTWGGGVSRYDGKRFTYFTEKEGLCLNTILAIQEDKNGNLWFGSWGGGVSRYDGKSFSNFSEEQGMSHSTINSILEDQSGSLWFGSYGGGVSRYDEGSFNHFTQKEGLSHDVIRYIMEDQSGDLWFGTWGGAVVRYDGESPLTSSGHSFTHISVKEGLSDRSVFSMLEDRNENLWFGYAIGGASRFDGENFTHFTQKEGLSSNTILSMLEDKDGNIWFGTFGGGISLYDGERFSHFTEKEGFSSNTIWSILEDQQGNLWFGTDGGGVSRYDGDRFTHFTEKEGLAHNSVWCLLEDKSGNLWFGTAGGGASRYDGETFTHFTEKEGLSNNTVRSILEDDSGNIWLSTVNGLNRISAAALTTLNDKNQSVLIDVFEQKDGLKAMDFWPNSAFHDSKNRMWWGSGKGLTMLDLNKHTINVNPPLVNLRELEINEVMIDYRNASDSLKSIVTFDSVQAFENYPLNLVLPYDQNHLTFHFSAIDWSATHKIEYSYLMEGLNTKWSEASPESKADYRNLPYGSYTFKLRAIGASGEWSEAFEYTFTINPPWWHSWWARTLYALFSLTLIISFLRWRTAQLKKRQKELEHEVEIATQEIKTQKSKVEFTLKEVEAQKLLIEEQKDQVEGAHKEITDSINYAERIQRSFLATEELLNERLGEHFIYFNPKEAVSGDFYWAGKLENGNFAVCCADSTGHGVPGAIMSILNISSIEKAVENKATEPAEIFNQARKLIIERLKKDGSEEGGKDGMDASLISFNLEKTVMQYVAAHNPIWIIRAGELIDIKAEKMPVGKHDHDHIPFEGGEFELQKGDVIYTLTDGYQDQFGGEKGKKYKVKPFKRLLLEICNLPMQKQHQEIADTFDKWKGGLEQVDDVCIIGVRL